MSSQFPIISDLPISDRQEIERINQIPVAKRSATEAAYIATRTEYLTNEIIEKDSAGNILRASGNEKPVDDLAGFAKGALFIEKDVAGGTNGLYVNIGTKEACEFVVYASSGSGGGGGTNPGGTITPIAITVNNALPISWGIPLKETDAILTTTSLVVKNSSGTVIPATFVVRARWKGIPTDTSKAIKWVEVNFEPTATGSYTISDAGGNTDTALLTVTSNVGDFQVVTDQLDVKIAKTGTDLITSLNLGGTERLTTTKPHLELNDDGITPTVSAGVYDLLNNQNTIDVDNASIFSVGQTVKFAWSAPLVSVGTHAGGTKSAVYVAKPPGVVEYLAGHSPKRQFIIDRGGANQEIFTADFAANGTYYGEIYASALLTITHAAGEIVEDYDAILIGNKTISAISSNTLTFSSNFTKPRVLGDPIIPTAGITNKTVKFSAQTTQIVRQNNRRAVIVQNGYFVDGASRYLDYIEGKVYYYFYANSPVVRIRTEIANRTNTGTIDPANQEVISLKYVVPTAVAGTGSDTVTSGATAISRYNAGNYSATIQAGTLKLAVPEFAPNFPKTVTGNGTGLTLDILPNTGVKHFLYAHHSFVTDFYLGINADAYMPLTTDALVSLDQAYVAATGAIRPKLPTQRTFLSSQFTNVGNTTAAELAEAANRYHRMMNMGFDYTITDPGVTIGQVDALRYRTLTGDSYGHEELGYMKFGNLFWSNTGNLTYNHYDTGFHALLGWLRTGNARGFKLGSETARYMATYGLFNSQNTDLIDWNQYGMNHFERSGIDTAEVAKPSHTWSESLWLYWALTGDDIVYNACLAHKTAATQYADTKDLVMANEGRIAGWTILEAITAYRYTGDATALNKANAYMTQLISQEQAQGGKGIFIQSGYLNTPTYTQPFSWAGYMMNGVIEHYYETLSTATRDFIIRVGQWLRKGDATLSSPGSIKVVLGGTTSGGNYSPLGIPFNWDTNPANISSPDVQEASIVIGTLLLAAKLSGDTNLKDLAYQVFRDCAFYKDVSYGARPASYRHGINFRSPEFGGTSVKAYGQTALGALQALPVIEEELV
jgi:hypothetical protein